MVGFAVPACCSEQGFVRPASNMVSDARMTLAGSWAPIEPSDMASRTVNPIRQIVDNMTKKPSAPTESKEAAQEQKSMLSLSIGDPCKYGNLHRHPQVTEAMVAAANDEKNDGYPPADGYLHVREAVAKYFSKEVNDVAREIADGSDVKEELINANMLEAKDVILASGCSHALEIALSALCNPGDNLLIPRPCFSLYKTIADSFNFEARFYNLVAERNWEVDLHHLETQIDKKTKAILISNPSNPCGSVFSKEHLVQILDLADRHQLPIVADEIYWDMVFGDNKFIPLASVSKNVPIISVGAISKRYLVPGWRLGWILLFDRGMKLRSLRDGMINLAQRLVGPNSLVQAALPNILANVPASYYRELYSTLENQANLCVESLKRIHGLRPIVPQGTMYVMVEVLTASFKDIKDDQDFCRLLLAEENVMVLPGAAFGIENFFRIVFCGPESTLTEAMERIELFCNRHKIES